MSDDLLNTVLTRTPPHLEAAVAQHLSSAHVTTLLSRAKRSLDEDLDLTRRYLEQLLALFSAEAGCNAAPDGLLLPQRLIEGALPIKGGLASWQVRRVTGHIEQKLDRTLVTEDLAAVVRLSTGHFCRAFKISMGETPHAYIIRQRIRRAQTLMLETRNSLSQIACASGLTDQAHLTRLFRRVVGTTPMTWRRNWQNVA